jgi:predicted dehydrogenase
MAGTTSRRQVLKASAVSAVALSAASYARAAGANERIRIALIGCGSKGVGAHLRGLCKYAKSENVEFAAMVDPWRQRREAAAAKATEWGGGTPRQFISYRDVMTRKDIDAVVIASCDHQHTTHLEAAAKTGKHVYCEKPLAMNLGKLKRACDAVKSAGVCAQIGTQLRSMPSFTGCRKLYGTGILGTVGRIEQHRNGTKPYWYGRVAKADPKDVEWKEFLMDARPQPFDAVRFTGWYGFRDFSDGPVPGLGSHFIDLVHYITGATFPKSSVCLGGTYTWADEHKFTCPDHVTALWDYGQFMVEYTTNFGNGSAQSFRILGDQGMLDMASWSKPVLTADGGSRNRGVIRGEKPVEPVERPDHHLDWLQCIRNGKTPNASIDAGYQHAVAVIMAMQSFDTGRRTTYDAKSREIREG